MMPGMSGYEVCQAIRAEPALAMLPVVHGHRARSVRAHQGAGGGRRRFPDEADQPARAARPREVAAAHQVALRRSAAPARRARELEPHARAARRGGRRASGAAVADEAVLLAAGRRAHPGRRNAKIRCAATAARSPSCSSTCAATPSSAKPRIPRKSWACCASTTPRWAGSSWHTRARSSASPATRS